tara:strand:+ start:861 stop:1871 length:1011 start_codon:yes stop_codon:yes gene_type:complete
MINVLRTVKNNKLYKLSHFKKIFFDKINLVGKTQNPEESLDRTFKWIKSSFEATPDKGSSAYYRFSTGWQGSYPETTGYLIPTLYEYSKYKNKPEYALIAKEAADWLIDIQTKEGGWQGLHIGKNCEPRVFNSGMILDGLISAYKVEKDEKYLKAAIKGCEWILDQLDKDNFFSNYNVVGGGSFDTLVCACLLMVIQYLSKDKKNEYEMKVRFSLNSLLTYQSENYWFKKCSFHNPNYALLHHIGYTLDGLIVSAEILEDDQYYTKAKNTARKLLSIFEVNLGLPAFLNSDWEIVNDQGSNYSMCLTGCSQISIVFQKIYEKEKDLRYLNARVGNY